MDLQTFCNIIILIGAVVGAIMGIMNFFGKPLKFMSRRLKQKQLEQHGRLVDEIGDAIMEKFQPKFEEVYQQNLEQEETINILIKSSRDILRKEILTIYHDHRAERKLHETTRELLDDLYKDYVAEDGNGYIKKIYNRMATWEIIPDEE